MKRPTLLYIFAVLLAMCGLSSCSETDDEVEEYPDWQSKNDAFFAAKYNAATQAIARGDNTWKVFKSYAKSSETTGKPVDHIVVKVIEEGSGSGCPLFTDTVRVHYRGQLIASTSYQDKEDGELGLVFDSSWRTDTYDASTFVPAKFAVSGVIDGFSTVLQHMHIGDRWKVYIPYSLGYGSTERTGIPTYSTLIFDLKLVAFYRPGATIPEWKAKGYSFFEE